MPKDILNEREFELINIVGARLTQNQRDLSRQMNLSLGMTNMLIKRLVTKGYIRIRQLNQRKVQYLLTPKGFTEKMHKSINYTLKTINSITIIKDKLRAILTPLYKRGERSFCVVGKSDLAFLVDVVFKEEGFNNCQISHHEHCPVNAPGMILMCEEERENPVPSNERRINLIYELAKNENVVNHI